AARPARRGHPDRPRPAPARAGPEPGRRRRRARLLALAHLDPLRPGGLRAGRPPQAPPLPPPSARVDRGGARPSDLQRAAIRRDIALPTSFALVGSAMSRRIAPR